MCGLEQTSRSQIQAGWCIKEPNPGQTRPAKPLCHSLVGVASWVPAAGAFDAKEQSAKGSDVLRCIQTSVWLACRARLWTIFRTWFTNNCSHLKHIGISWATIGRKVVSGDAMNPTPKKWFFKTRQWLGAGNLMKLTSPMCKAWGQSGLLLHAAATFNSRRNTPASQDLSYASSIPNLSHLGARSRGHWLSMRGKDSASRHCRLQKERTQQTQHFLHFPRVLRCRHFPCKKSWEGQHVKTAANLPPPRRWGPPLKLKQSWPSPPERKSDTHWTLWGKTRASPLWCIAWEETWTRRKQKQVCEDFTNKFLTTGPANSGHSSQTCPKTGLEPGIQCGCKSRQVLGWQPFGSASADP